MDWAMMKIRNLWDTYGGCFRNLHLDRIASFSEARVQGVGDLLCTFASLLDWRLSMYVLQEIPLKLI